MKPKSTDSLIEVKNMIETVKKGIAELNADLKDENDNLIRRIEALEAGQQEQQQK